MMKDFFISYNQNDSEWAQWIAWQLENEADYDCILMDWDSRPGQDFMQQMRQAIKNSQQIIAILSYNYFKSQYCMAEVNTALVDDPVGNKFRLIPVRVKLCKPEELLGSRIYIDLVGKKEDEAKKILLQGVRASRMLRTKPESAPLFPSRPDYPGGVEKFAQTNTTKLKSNNLKLLFTAYDGGLDLDLRKELEIIEQMLHDSGNVKRIAIESKFDMTGEEFYNILESRRPNIFHFAGNLQPNAIILKSKRGGYTTISTDALLFLFRVMCNEVRFVFFNACHSLNCAKALTEFIDCTIGVEKYITDDEALFFAENFYKHLFSGKSIADSFDLTQSRYIFQERFSQDNLPQLLTKEGVDPNKISINSFFQYY